MSIPLDHHYLPEFYSKRWVSGQKSQLSRFTRPYDKVVVDRKSPRATGYSRELYSIKTRSDPVLRQAVEIGFMSKLDTDAAIALSHIEKKRKGKPLTLRSRQGWSRFVVSLIFRSPEGLKQIARMVETSNDAIVASAKARFEADRMPGNTTTFENRCEALSCDVPEESKSLLLCGIIDNPDLNACVARMNWSVHHFPPGCEGLLTSDRPVITSNGIGLIDGFIVLPIGPRSIFIATNRHEEEFGFLSQEPALLVHALNDAIVRQAQEVVIGQDSSHLSFVEERLRRGSSNVEPGALGRITWTGPVVFRR